jgi:hypothetical protein
MAINKRMRECLDENAIVFDNPSFDYSIVGTDEYGRVIYDYDKMVTELMNDDNISEEESMDFISYNTLRVIPYAGEMAPIVMYKIREWMYG